MPALGSWQEQRWGLNLGLGCTCIHSLLCPITVSQKPLDTGYKGLDVDAECPWPADLIVLSLQTPRFVCRQPLIGGFLTEILPDSCWELLCSAWDPELQGPNLAGGGPQTRISPSDFAVVKPPGWTSAGRGALTSEGLSLLFLSLFKGSSPHAATLAL